MSRLSPTPESIDGSPFRFGIVAARYNQEYVDGLLDGVIKALQSTGVIDSSIIVERVPGSNELPIGVKLLACFESFDALIALGVIIQGGTRHFEMVADGVNYGLHKLALEEGIPVVNGVIVGATEEDVRERCLGSLPKGNEFGQCALEMAAFRRRHK